MPDEDGIYRDCVHGQFEDLLRGFAEGFVSLVAGAFESGDRSVEDGINLFEKLLAGRNLNHTIQGRIKEELEMLIAGSDNPPEGLDFNFGSPPPDDGGN